VPLFATAERPAVEHAALALDARGTGAFAAQVPGPWSAAFTVAAFERALDAHYAPELLRALGRRGDPAAFDRLHERAEAAGELPRATARQAAGALALLDLRRGMRTNLPETT
jgi:hypothetical protein